MQTNNSSKLRRNEFIDESLKTMMHSLIKQLNFEQLINRKNSQENEI